MNGTTTKEYFTMKKKTAHPHLEKHPPAVLFSVGHFPGFEAYAGGGAERILERLITAYEQYYPNRNRMHLHVGSKKKLHARMRFSTNTTEDPERVLLPQLAAEMSSSDAIIHFGSTYFITHHPEQFIRIAMEWKGHIIQRVTLTSKITDLYSQHGLDVSQHILQAIDIFISQSAQMTKELIALDIPEHKIVQIENGIDCVDKFPETREEKKRLRKMLLPSAQRSEVIFLYAARLKDPIKRADELISLWIDQQLGDKGYTLVLAGSLISQSNTPESSLDDIIRTYSREGLEKRHIFFTGLIDEQKLESYYKLSDVYVTTSEREGFSNSALEAMAYGLPVIGRVGVSGHEELIIPEQTGLVFQDTSGLLAHIERLGNDEQLRSQLGQYARRHIEERYSIKQMVEKYMQLYDVLSRKTHST